MESEKKDEEGKHTRFYEEIEGRLKLPHESVSTYCKNCLGISRQRYHDLKKFNREARVSFLASLANQGVSWDQIGELVIKFYGEEEKGS